MGQKKPKRPAEQTIKHGRRFEPEVIEKAIRAYVTQEDNMEATASRFGCDRSMLARWAAGPLAQKVADELGYVFPFKRTGNSRSPFEKLTERASPPLSLPGIMESGPPPSAAPEREALSAEAMRPIDEIRKNRKRGRGASNYPPEVRTKVLLVALRQPDKPVLDIAAEMGVTYSVVYAWLRDYGPQIAEAYGLPMRKMLSQGKRSKNKQEKTLRSRPSADLAVSPPRSWPGSTGSHSERPRSFVASEPLPVLDQSLDELKDQALRRALKERDALITVMRIMQTEKSE